MRINISLLAKLLYFWRYPRYFREAWHIVRIRKLIRNIITIDKSVRFYGVPIISMIKDSQITIGKNCVLTSTSKDTALGVNHPVILRTLTRGATIIIGENTGISGGSICAALRVEIGCGCLIGANVTIADTDFHSTKPEGRRDNGNICDIASNPIIIEDNVFIGTGAIILKGVRIGKNSVIGAGSVVTKDAPSNTIVAGNPAIILKNL